VSAGELVLAQLEIRSRRGGTCVSENGFCPGWIVENLWRYVDPLVQHVVLTVASVAIGFVIAFALALLAHRRQWLTPPVSAFTSILFTIPSVAAFLLLLPVTGRGALTAIIALVAYTQVFLFRNAVNGLGNVAEEAKDAARGMGLTDRQVLWRVELPLAVPEILAGLRIATVTTVNLATLAFFAGAGGLGAQIYQDITFRSNVVVAGGLAVLLAAACDLLILGGQRLATPWRRAAIA
jgi:osmoprotectant transport system permease protein